VHREIKKKITYNEKLPHYRFFYYRKSNQQNHSAELYTQAVKLSYFLSF